MGILKYKLDPRDEQALLMASTVYAVEATRFEQHTLWGEFSHDGAKHWQRAGPGSAIARHEWRQYSGGWMPTIGRFNGGGSSKYPVTMSMSWAQIDGFWVLFYDLTSRYCDHDLSREWLFNRMPHLFPNGIDKGGLLTDATNFAHALHHIGDLIKKGTPRQLRTYVEMRLAYEKVHAGN